MHGLVYYDPTVGEAEFYTTDGQGRITRTRLHIGWRSAWTKIIPGNFGADGFTDLLFYDPSTGTGEFYRTDERGRIHLLSQHARWRSSWTQIIPGNFGGSGHTDLLFYDAAAGTGEFYSTDGQGGITQLALYTDWRNSWSQIIPGNFSAGGEFTDVLFYDAAAGTGEFYSTDGQGGITQLALYTGWRTTWTKIIPGDFGGTEFTDLLFYEASSGTGEFYVIDGQNAMRQLALHSGWRSSWTQIIPGNFGGTGFTDLLFYEASSGTGEFYATDHGGISPLRTFTDWRTSWGVILAGEFATESLCLGVHFKSLIPITQAVSTFMDTQFANMFQLFARSGITLLRGPDEDLSGNMALTPLQNLDIGACAGAPTQDQRDLFVNRNNVGENDVVIYVVATLISMTGNTIGCATHPDGQPGAAVVQSTAKWLTAHEIGHVLDLPHNCTFPSPQTPNPGTPCVAGSDQSDRLMFPNVGWTNVPPDLTTSEEDTMRNSGLTNRC